MELPAPIFLDLSSLIGNNSAGSNEHSVWKIGVTSGNSLYWSILLSYLLSADDERFLKLIEKLKENKNTKTGRDNKCLSSKFDFQQVKEMRKCFNCNDKLMEAFKKELIQFGGNLVKSKPDTWSDDFKLQAASEMLNCNIEVYFTKENKVTFEPDPQMSDLPKITLFQDMGQIIGLPSKLISVYHFAVTIKHAHLLQLSVLAYFLNVVGLWLPEEIAYVMELMDDMKENGRNFLAKLIQNGCIEILPSLYKSPYIALKLSQAGFETNPAVKNETPSVFLFAAAEKDTKYIRILYDYAANCRYRFEMTTRDPNDIILESLSILQDILTTDISYINTCEFKTDMEHGLSILSQFSRFNMYQQDIALKIMKQNNLIRQNSCTGSSELNSRKDFIKNILASYSEYFYFDMQHSTMLEKFHNYIKFTEYYENLDTFSCLTFFDSIYSLKKIFQMKNGDIFAGIESAFFLLAGSNKVFHASGNRKMPGNLRFIPLLYRETLKEEILKFSKALIKYDASNLVPPKQIKGETMMRCLSSFPEIKDEFLICRIRSYLYEAVDIPVESNEVKVILAIERALQVLGESLKNQTTDGCVVSCLLRSRLPLELVKKLKNIRNDISKYHANSVVGRREIERHVEYFKEMQIELQEISKLFDVVALTQYWRVQSFLIESGLEKLAQQKLNQTIVCDFKLACDTMLENQKTDKNQHTEVIQLSLDVIKYLLKFKSSEEDSKTLSSFDAKNIRDILESIKCVFKFLSREVNQTFFQSYLDELENYSIEYMSNNDISRLYLNMVKLEETYTDAIYKHFSLQNVSRSKSQFPILFSFFDILKQNEISKDIEDILKAKVPTLLPLLSNLKDNKICAKDIDDIINAAKDAFRDANNAKVELNRCVGDECITISSTEKRLLDKLMISKESLKKLKLHLNSKNWKLASKELNKTSISEKILEEKIKDIFVNDVSQDEIVRTVLIKIAFQNNLKEKIYESVILSNDLIKKLHKFFQNEATFLLNRIENMKSVLSFEDRENESTWISGIGEEVNHDLRFFMRQMFSYDMPVQSTLEMLFLDCLNILRNKNFIEMQEKVNYLCTGMNLRQFLAHGYNVFETIGNILDEDDLPSELINKIVELIDDFQAVATILKLIPLSNTLEKDTFIEWIENKEDVHKSEKEIVASCERWQSYLSLFPLI